MRVFFGGSFDPVHHGHIAVARCLRDVGAKVFMLVSVNPPFREPPQVSAEHRMAMLHLALGADKDVCVARGDSVCESPYTIDVLRSARSCLGNEAPLAWALGSDQYAHLNTWREWEGLIELAHLIVFPRLGMKERIHVEVSRRMDACHCAIDRLLSQPSGCVAEVASAPPEVSSTEIRSRLRKGKSVSGRLPESVLDYIHSQELYGAA